MIFQKIKSYKYTRNYLLHIKVSGEGILDSNRSELICGYCILYLNELIYFFLSFR